MEYLEAVVLVVVLLAVGIVVISSFLVRTALSRSEALSQRLTETQAELGGRLTQLGEAQAVSQAEINRTLEASLNHHTEKTGKSMSDLHERLAVIDSAQKKITDLSEQVVGLQDILSNKQARGAFGEIQLNDLVASMLPPSAYDLQATLSNNKRADCLLKLPNPPGSIVVDAKFPLESYQGLRDAASDDARVVASRAFGNDVRKHIKDIAERYIVPGETAEMALMFLPSEAVSAELHANHRAVIEESFKRRVVVVSPTTMWATLNAMRAILKDVTMREQAGLIQAEVLNLLEDVGRLDKRVENLNGHFRKAVDDVELIRKSSKKITKRGERIQDIELGEDVAAEELPDDAGKPRLVPFPGGKE